jgi:hypothetical protein
MTRHCDLTFSLAFILMTVLMLAQGKPGFAQNAVSDAWQQNIPSNAAALKEEAKVLIEQRDYQGAMAKQAKLSPQGGLLSRRL